MRGLGAIALVSIAAPRCFSRDGDDGASPSVIVILAVAGLLALSALKMIAAAVLSEDEDDI